MRLADVAALDRIDFAKQDGLVPVVTQDVHTGVVLMLAYANREALERTLREGRMWYWSRSRAALWRKGETSGHELQLHALHLDCDADTVLALVEATGPACHTGARDCFGASPVLAELGDVIAERAARPDAAGSYTRRLLDDANLRLKKIGEEATELVLACAAGDRERVAEEAADVWYHTLVACRAVGVDVRAVLGALAERRSSAAGTSPVQQ